MVAPSWSLIPPGEQTCVKRLAIIIRSAGNSINRFLLVYLCMQVVVEAVSAAFSPTRQMVNQPEKQEQG
jgi:hypothetical protein